MIHVKTFGFYSAGGRMPLVDFYFFNFKNVIFLKNFVIVPSLQKYYKNYAENLSTYFRFTDYQFAHLLDNLSSKSFQSELQTSSCPFTFK